MKVLVACEFSGTVRDAFIRNGHNAVSCDLLPTANPGPHYQGDVREILHQDWDLMVAHPPCTELAISGNGNPWRTQQNLDSALSFVLELMLADIPRICVENPVGLISTYICKPTQVVDPWWFGDEHQKRTCLWLKNLPKLEKQNPTLIFDPNYYHNLPAGKDRWKYKSWFWPGFAKAMADQWGSLKAS